MTEIHRWAGHRLLETGVVTEFEVVKTEIHEGPDAAEFTVEIELRFPPDPETEETDLEWGAFGFLFAIGALSFADARPRELSVLEYVESDEFEVGDFVSCLHWEGGALKLSADYVRGRRMKTDVVLRSVGSGTLTTTGRGKAAVLWLERLKGRTPLRLVER